LNFIHQGVASVRVQEITDGNECMLVNEHDTVVVKQFPRDWEGKWCGMLQVFNERGKTTQVPMKLNIRQGVDSLSWQWQIVYDTTARDYELHVAGDSLRRSFSIDEKNGIVLPATLLGNTLVSTFEVSGNRIDATYTLDGDRIVINILSVESNHVLQTGLGTDVSPKVSAYSPNAYQTAVLERKE
jgi:hypothetical protein